MTMSVLDCAAKAVAEGRQHGCHYAEGTCYDCRRIATAVLKAIHVNAPLAFEREACWIKWTFDSEADADAFLRHVAHIE